jgi:hypothetical protein
MLMMMESKKKEHLEDLRNVKLRRNLILRKKLRKRSSKR